jgi:hypothetical protein
MYYTHHFANHETLTRARSWLSRLGFGPESMEAHTDGIPRITVTVDPSRWSGVEMLIHAVERSDPRGWPGLWDVAAQKHVYPEPKEERAATRVPRSPATLIGWHPPDLPATADPVHDAFCEQMNRRRG